jgi:hypothetical protein
MGNNSSNTVDNTKNQPQQIIFTDIKPGNIPHNNLSDEDYKKFLINGINNENRTFTFSWLEKPQKNQDQKIILQGLSKANDLIHANKNGLLHTLYLAYTHHLFVKLRPDDIFMAILNGFQMYTNKYSNELRSKFVDFNDKKQITIEANFTLDGENPWHEMFDAFANECKNNITDKKLYDIITDKYSTSNDIDIAAYNIGLISGLKNYFNYEMYTLCGIAGIKLLGNKDDWVNLKNRTLALGNFMKEDFVDKWFKLLIPVLDEFIKVCDGQIDHKFWGLIFKEHVFFGSGGYNCLSGWFSVFFPYLKHDMLNEYIFDFTSVENFKNNYNIKKGINSDNIPNLEYNAPIKWKYLGTSYDMEFRAGSLGVCGDKETNEIWPNVGYYVFRQC